MINTNGFITEYINTTGKINSVTRQIKDLEDTIAPYYEEAKKLKAKYNYVEIEKSLSSKNDELFNLKSQHKYFYYRAIVDGLHNLLIEFGWKFEQDLFDWLYSTYNIRSCFEDGFNPFYIDYICSLTNSSRLYERRKADTIVLAYENDVCDGIYIPYNLSIDTVLTEAQKFLREIKATSDKDEANEELQLYLKLKAKYESV